MPSPFPGMNPFLEGPAFWSDFHFRFVNTWCETVAGCLPDAYSARIGERVYLVEQPPVTKKLILPDVALADTGRRGGGGTAVLAPPRTTLEPVVVPLGHIEEGREAYIEILHRPDHTLVAVLELFSPANKENPGRIEYLAKRNAILRQQVHLVELDLLRDGLMVPMAKPLPPGDYHYLLSRWEERPNCNVYAWTMRDVLPGLPVPLKAPDPDVIVSLQEVFAETFRRGRYDRDIDYAAPPPGTLRETDRRWIKEVLEKAAQPAKD